jgi:hypothetical protein
MLQKEITFSEGLCNDASLEVESGYGTRINYLIPDQDAAKIPGITT